MADISEIKKRLQGRLTEAPKGPATVGKVQQLIDDARKQLETLDKVAKAKTYEEQKEAVVPQSSWIKVRGFNDFVIKIGRAGYPYYGEQHKHFAAKSVKEAREIIEDIKDLVMNDEDFAKSIASYEAPKKPKK